MPARLSDRRHEVLEVVPVLRSPLVAVRRPACVSRVDDTTSRAARVVARSAQWLDDRTGSLRHPGCGSDTGIRCGYLTTLSRQQACRRDACQEPVGERVVVCAVDLVLAECR